MPRGAGLDFNGTLTPRVLDRGSSLSAASFPQTVIVSLDKYKLELLQDGETRITVLREFAQLAFVGEQRCG